MTSNAKKNEKINNFTVYFECKHIKRPAGGSDVARSSSRCRVSKNKSKITRSQEGFCLDFIPKSDKANASMQSGMFLASYWCDRCLKKNALHTHILHASSQIWAKLRDWNVKGGGGCAFSQPGSQGRAAVRSHAPQLVAFHELFITVFRLVSEANLATILPALG